MYLIRLFIDLLPFPPVPGADDPDHTLPDGESDGHDALADLSDAVVPFLGVAMFEVSKDDALGVQEGTLGEAEGNMMFSLIFDIVRVIRRLQRLVGC